MNQLAPHEGMRIAHWAAKIAPPWLWEDAVQEAWIGILEAQRSFDPALGSSQSRHAVSRARGAVLDFMRRLDPLSRSERQQVKAELRDDVNHVELFDFHATTSSEDPAIIRRVSLEQLRRKARFTPKQARAVEMALEDRTLKQMGQALGVGEARSSQLLAGAVQKMRKAA